ncbi:MAG TPA: hypothetical protein VHW01_18630 [Polyangiaceae bacterium]|jgi:hypothetical protein|nr:hypothetical protein [Polyangiaceae bacterium]
MPDPISSSSVSNDLTCVDPSTEPNACLPPAPAPTVCAAPSPPSEADTNAAAELATAYLRTDHSAFIEASKAPSAPPSPTPETDNNAYRTTIRHDNGIYSHVGVTEDKQSAFAAVALHKSDHEHGTLELASFSEQVGAQHEFQVGLLRAGTHSINLDGVHLTANFEAGTARVNGGTHNDDGSHGFNLGAGATAIGAEATVEYSGWSFTFGESLAVGGGFSSGEARDIDGDGRPERCFKGNLGPLTVGFCTER